MKQEHSSGNQILEGYYVVKPLNNEDVQFINPLKKMAK